MPVVLVHGLWLNGLEFFVLRDRLRSAGFSPSSFRYHSMHATLREAADALAAQLKTLGDTAHVVAHSLGGLIACEAYGDQAESPKGRIVLLGAPVRGSRTARAVAAHPFGPAMLGPLAVTELARERHDIASPPREVGVIVGTRSIGAGRLFSDLPVPNDGTVCLDETELTGAFERTLLDVSHTGMLFSREVADATIAFLREGRFPHRGA